MSLFIGSSRLFDSKDHVPNFKAIQKVISFYHRKKNTEMYEVGCTIPNLDSIYLHNSKVFSMQATDADFNPSTQGDKDFPQKSQKNLTGGLFTVFTHKANIDRGFSRKSPIVCQPIVGIDVSQLYPFSICQPMPTGFYMRWDLDTDTSGFTPRQKYFRSIENLVVYFNQCTRYDCKIGSFHTKGRQKKTSSLFLVFVLISTKSLKLWDAFVSSVLVKKYSLLSLKKMFGAVLRKENSMIKLTETKLYKKVCLSMRCGSVVGGESLKQTLVLENIHEKCLLTDVHLHNNNSCNK